MLPVENQTFFQEVKMQTTIETRNEYHEAVIKMATTHKIKIIPVLGKRPCIDDWTNQGSYDPVFLRKWVKEYPNCRFGMPTDQFWCLDRDGKNFGKIKKEWLSDNPVQQATKTKGNGHSFFKHPKDKKVGNKIKFTGDFDHKGAGGQVVIYECFFNEFVSPADVPEAPQELLDLLTYVEDTSFGPGKNNKNIASRAGKAGASGSITQLANSLIELVQNNPGNPELGKHVTDYLKKSNDVFALYHQPKTISLPTKDKKQKGDPGPEHPSQQGTTSKQKKKDEKKGIETELDPKPIICEMKDKLLAETDLDKAKVKPTFFDKKNSLFPDVNALLLTGDTESGKSALSLKFLKSQIEKGKKVAIWEHSEMNRQNRLNEWKETIEKKYRDNILITYDKLKILECFKPGYIILIDDCDSFMQIKNAISRREVGNCMEDISWIAQLTKCLIILNHYMTKTSKGEKNVKSRSGGGAVWINKARYAYIIEEGTQDTELVGNEINPKEVETRVKQASYITTQKGYRPGKPKIESWWLTEAWEIGDKISDDLRKSMITDSVEGQDDSLVKYDKLIQDYMKEAGKNKMPKKAFYKLCLNNCGIGQRQADRYLDRLKRYQVVSEGFREDKTAYIICS